MKYRSTLVYLLLAVLLIGVYLYETRREEKEKAAVEQSKVLFPLKAEQIRRITLKPAGREIVMEKSGTTEQETWSIMAPVKTDADRFPISNVADTLAGLKYVRMVSEEPRDMAEFGLKDPALVVSFDTEQRTHTLSFGNQTPVEDGFYAHTAKEKTVFIVSSMDKAALDKTLFDLRDKRLFRLGTEEVNRVEIQQGPLHWILLEKEGQWTLSGDEAFKVDKEKVTSAIRRITWQEAQTFEKESPDDLSPYGLDQPRIRLALSAADQREEILLGAFVDDEKKNRIYAKMADRPPVVTVDKALIEAIPLTKDEIRQEEAKKEEQPSASGATPVPAGVTPVPDGEGTP